MLSVTLLTKAQSNHHRKLVDDFLKSALRGLNVKLRMTGTTPHGWVQLVISGDDERVALQYLNDNIGFCPIDLKRVQTPSTVKGQIEDLSKDKTGINVDIGIISPCFTDVVIPLHNLQAQLADGRKIALAKIAELFGLCEDSFLTVKIPSIDKQGNHIDGILSEEQLARYRKWTRSLLDRLTILGSPRHEVMFALEATGSNRDVVKIESQGLFEHAIACKLGTDAVGLIPKIGRRLRGAHFSVFSPRKIMDFFDEQPAR
jgi:hypothetical protein